jgi:small GTP-binding protein
LSKVVKVHSKKIRVTLWDTAGEERYKAMSKIYYKGASGVLFIYSIVDAQSYIDVESWMRLVSNFGAS